MMKMMRTSSILTSALLVAGHFHNFLNLTRHVCYRTKSLNQIYSWKLVIRKNSETHHCTSVELYDQTIVMREKKLDLEEAIMEEKKIIDTLKKELDALVKKNKVISTDS